MLRSLFKGAITLATVSLILSSSLAFAAQPALAGPPEGRPVAGGKSDAKFSIWPLANKVEALSTLADLLQLAEIEGKLAGNKGPFTVFAPTNDAFDALFAFLAENDPELLEELQTNQDLLIDVLLYHVVAGAAVTSDQVMPGMITMANEDDVEVSFDGDDIKINDATVVLPDVMARNGVVHVIDAVLVPPMDMMEEMRGKTPTSSESTSFGGLKAGFQR